MKLDLRADWRHSNQFIGSSQLATMMHVVAWLILLTIVALMSVSKAL